MFKNMEQAVHIADILDTPKKHVIFGTICLGSASFLIIVGAGSILTRNM